MGKMRIVSHSSDIFTDKTEAGRLLAHELLAFSKNNPLVLAIPRGGVIVGWQVAQALHAELDVSLSCKLGSPSNPDMAIGAVSESGQLILNRSIVDRINIYKGYIEEQREKNKEMLKKRADRYRAVRPKVPLDGRFVIVVDDGLATGATMQAALWSARRAGPKTLVAAVPVASMDALERISNDADEVITLRAPSFLYTISQFYTRFEQTSDEEVIALLKESMERKAEQRKSK